MFGGGRAHLALVGSDDPLEAGLEIYAQPPGKKLATLSLLSGGEQALTALSLIFAVFRCNPAPICVLDEVDAPLDDANVERFCTLLEDMVRETGTRFLVVTHHPLTMARMDRLYGVTMQERGVSRLLSVDLQRRRRWPSRRGWRRNEWWRGRGGRWIWLRFTLSWLISGRRWVPSHGRPRAPAGTPRCPPASGR